MILRTALLLVTALASCAAIPTLKDFTSDGCSLFPEGNAQNPQLWCECCYQHDIAYWRGGTWAERLHADEQLRACISIKTGDAALAQTMFMGVRAGGSPVFPTGYRWGYGWSYGRDYTPLSAAEQRSAEEKLARRAMAKNSFSCGR